MASTFSLAPLDGGEAIPLEIGEHTVGRGPFLRVIDKRVSRQHAIIQVTNTQVIVKPIHTNPTFFKASNATNFEALEKNLTKELHDGDCISFLPTNLVFKVIRNEACIKIDAQENQKDSTEAKNEQQPLDENIDHEKAYDDKIDNNAPNSPFEKTEEELAEYLQSVEEKKNEPVKPLSKTRQLPSWMTIIKNKEDKTQSKEEVYDSTTTTDEPQSPKGTNGDSVKTDTNTEQPAVVNKSKTTDGVDTVKDDLDSEENKELVEVLTEPSKKRKRETDIIENDDKSKKILPLCPYGSHCYRKNPIHFQEYSHDTTTDSGEKATKQDDLPECPYGLSCYRKNPKHQQEFKHTDFPETRPRRAKKPKKRFSDEEDGPNDYDFEDSFIDDESESSVEASEDSDWQPDGESDKDDDIEEEDVEELMSEAKDFARNKKMHR